MTIYFSFAKIRSIRYVSSCALGTSMTDSVRFPVKILVKQVTEAEVSLDKANLQRVPLNKGSLHVQKCVDKDCFIT